MERTKLFVEFTETQLKVVYAGCKERLINTLFCHISYDDVGRGDGRVIDYEDLQEGKRGQPPEL